MTDRSKQIEEAAASWTERNGSKGDYQISLDVIQGVAFEAGAEWADQNPAFDFKVFTPGTYLIFRSDYPESLVGLRGWKESGLLGGTIIREPFEVYESKELARLTSQLTLIQKQLEIAVEALKELNDFKDCFCDQNDDGVVQEVCASCIHIRIGIEALAQIEEFGKK